jgi:N-acyl-D-aspartate/D-glutamate deacylase
MAALAGDAVRAGALGFSTSRTLNHRTSTGDYTPTLKAGEDELTAIAGAMHKVGRSVLQFVLDQGSIDEDLPMMLRVAENTKCPISFSVTQADKAPRRWRQTLDSINEASARGLSITAQIAARPVGLLLGLELSRNPFQTHPSYKAIAKLPLAERLARLRQPEVRAAILSETRPRPTIRCSSGRTTTRCICSAIPRITNSRRKMRWARRPAVRDGSRKNWPMTRCSPTRAAACSMCRS